MDVDEGVHRPVDDVEPGGGGGCEVCVALARGRVKAITTNVQAAPKRANKLVQRNQST